MWECKHCKKEFNFSTISEKANHSRWCDQNPKRDNWNKTHGPIKIHGKFTEFEVKCDCCNIVFKVVERSKLYPQKDKYYCSRSCANSIGGKAKAEKYGITSYATIAERYYKRKCAVCGIEDILEVHHIDENRENCHPSNLIFLCPNDHYRLHRNKDENVKRVIEGHGTAWGGHFFCKEDVSRVQIPDAPPDYFLTE